MVERYCSGMPSGRKREVPASEQELFAHELRPEDFGVPALLESEYDLEPASRDALRKRTMRTPRLSKERDRLLGFGVIYTATALARTSKSTLTCLMRSGSWLSMKRKKASATPEPRAAATVGDQVMPRAATLENVLLPSTLQTRTRSASTEGDSTDALAQVVTSTP